MNLSIDLSVWQGVFLVIDYAIKIFAIGFVPEGRRPSSSTAWLLAILLLPFIGLPLFLLMGSPYINRRRHRLQQQANAQIEDVQKDVPDHPLSSLNPEVESVIRLNRTLTGFPTAVGRNTTLHANYHAALQALVRAIDAAQESILVEVYIQSWDDSTDDFYRALERAVRRGVKVRLLLDQIGSLKYKGYWTLGRKLTRAGIDWRLTLPLQLHKARFRRPDLRNHRKLIVIDNTKGFMGSMNLIKRGYRTRNRLWIDYLVEMDGPIVTSMATVFAVDWMAETNEIITLPAPDRDVQPRDNLLQMIPSGPGYTTEPNLRMFNSLIHHAKDRLILCSPYFIPDESMLEAVTTACYRGAKVELYVSKQADQFTVNHAQSSYYQALLEAGVRIFQFPEPFVLHSKFLIADPDGTNPLVMFGSSNMDMRSFGLNYESTMLIAQGSLIEDFAQLAHNYRSVSHELTLEEWNQRSFIRRYIDNVMRLTSALQ